MAKNDGGPAYPVYTGNPKHWENGMTLQDWFAGQVISGYVASGAGGTDWKLFANLAYRAADAMITARNGE